MEGYLVQRGIPFMRMPLCNVPYNAQEFQFEEGFDIRTYVPSPFHSQSPSPVSHAYAACPSPRQFFTSSPFMNQWNMYRPPMSPMMSVPQNVEISEDKRNVFEKLGKTYPFPPYNIKNQKNFMLFIRSPQCLHWLELSWSIACFIVYGNQKAEKSIHSLTDGEIYDLTKRAQNCGLLSIHLRQNKNSEGFNGDILFSSEIIARNFIEYGKKQLTIDFNFAPNQAFLKIEWHNESIYGKRIDIKNKNHEENESKNISQKYYESLEPGKKIVIETIKIEKKSESHSDNAISPAISIKSTPSEDVKDSSSSPSQTSIFKRRTSPFRVYEKKMSDLTEISVGEDSQEKQSSFLHVIKKPQSIRFNEESLPALKPLVLQPLQLSISNLSNNEIEYIFDSFAKRIANAVKKIIKNNIDGIKYDILENGISKSIKYNIVIHEKLEHESNGKKIILHLSEIINNPIKDISFFKKLQNELKGINSELYFHIYSKNIENNFVLEISKKY